MFALFRHRLSAALEASLFWLLVGLVLAAGYTYRHDLRHVADRIMAELMPGRAAARGQIVEIARAQRGDFQVSPSQWRAASRRCSTPAPAPSC